MLLASEDIKQKQNERNSEKYGLPSPFLTKQEEWDNCYSSST